MQQLQDYIRKFWSKACGCAPRDIDDTFVTACAQLVQFVNGGTDDRATGKDRDSTTFPSDS